MSADRDSGSEEGKKERPIRLRDTGDDKRWSRSERKRKKEKEKKDTQL